MLERNDFDPAEVEKLSNRGYWRAKLDDANRLLFRIAGYNGERYALLVEEAGGEGHPAILCG